MGCLKSGHATLQDAFVGKAVQYEVPVLLHTSADHERCVACVHRHAHDFRHSRPFQPAGARAADAFGAGLSLPRGRAESRHSSPCRSRGNPLRSTKRKIPSLPSRFRPCASRPSRRSTAWTSFATDTPVTVQVTNTTAFFSARILPSSANIVPTLSGNNGNSYTVASFTLGGGGPQQVSVEFCYTASASFQCTEKTQVLTDITNPLLVFANPLSANVPPLVLVPRTGADGAAERARSWRPAPTRPRSISVPACTTWAPHRTSWGSHPPAGPSWRAAPTSRGSSRSATAARSRGSGSCRAMAVRPYHGRGVLHDDRGAGATGCPTESPRAG